MYDSYSDVAKPYGDWQSDATGSVRPERSSSSSSNSKEFSNTKTQTHSRTMFLPAERTGAVIGKNGRMKHLIKEVCNVWMSIKSEPYESDSSKRVCVIRGPTVENLNHAESLINELLRDRETVEKSISLDTSDDVGRVIGSGGSNIQIIKDKTGAFVYVDKENVSAQYAGRCIIRGNSVQVLAAEKRVHELLARRDMMLMDNGGQKTGKKSGTNEKHDSSPDSSQNQLDQSEIGIWNGGETWTSQKEVDREQERNAKKRIQDTILIPLQAVGMVIGKKGKNIKIIQETSGANVYIDKEYQGSDDNALCVILGKHEQVSIAKVMIKEKLNQYNSANTFTILDNDGIQISHDPQLNSPHSSTGSNNQTFLSSPSSMTSSMINSNYFSPNNLSSPTATPSQQNHHAYQNKPNPNLVPQNYFNFNNIDQNNNNIRDPFPYQNDFNDYQRSRIDSTSHSRYSNVSPMSPFGQTSAEPSPSSSQFGLSSLGLEKLALNMMPKSSNTTVGMKGGNRDYQLITGGAHHGHHHMGASNQKQPIQPYGGQAYWQTN